jgi:A/G-specific adenine glycosylase
MPSFCAHNWSNLCETVNASPKTLLKWYDEHARDMPWRVSPSDRLAGVLPDPYHVWLSAVMLQQTTVAAVCGYFVKFIGLWPSVHDLAAAEDSDVMAAWAGLGYYARARNLLKCARVVSCELGGIFPRDEKGLQALPGIGPYTSAAIASIAFDVRAIVLDGNVERVMARVHAVLEPLPPAKEGLRALADTLTPKRRVGDYAQAVMDLGATVCTPRNPKCVICPWAKSCAGRKAGIEQSLPRKLPKPVKPTRVGVAYVLLRADGAVLLERRPDKGLLGGMLGWPGSDWAIEQIAHEPPVHADWMTLNTQVRHTFTHFHLILTVKVANVTTATVGDFVTPQNFNMMDLPTVMRKIWIAANP